MEKVFFLALILFSPLFGQVFEKNRNIYVEFKGSLNGPAPGIGYALFDSTSPWEYGFCISWTLLLDPAERKNMKFMGGKLRIEFDKNKRETDVSLYPLDFWVRYKIFGRDGLFVGGGLSSVFASVKAHPWAEKEKSGEYFYPSVYSEIGLIKRDFRFKNAMMIFLRPSFIYFLDPPLHIKKDAPLIKYDIIYFFGLALLF